MKVIELDVTDSTNEYIKRLNFDRDVAVAAARQTSGKGTNGRSFISDTGGLYISVLRVFKGGKKAERSFEIMINASVAICRTLERFGLKPVIRWPNDVLVGGKKISGTLIENIVSEQYILRSIVGIGLNVNNVLPIELKPFATTMSTEGGMTYELKKVRHELLKNFEKNFTMSDYKHYINWLGECVTLSRNGEREEVCAADISEDGRLVCSTGGRAFSVCSSEAVLRIGDQDYSKEIHI